jgi:hypothetical protein
VLAAKGAGLLDGFGEQGPGRRLLAAGSDGARVRGRREDIAPGRADAEDPDAVRIDLGPGGEVGDGGLEVLDPVRGVFEPAWLAADLPLVSGVESEGNETLLGQPARVEPGGLLLDAAAGMPDDDAGTRTLHTGVEVPGQGDPGAVPGRTSKVAATLQAPPPSLLTT